MLELLDSDGSSLALGQRLTTPRPIAISFSPTQTGKSHHIPSAPTTASAVHKHSTRLTFKPGTRSGGATLRPTSAGARLVSSRPLDPQQPPHPKLITDPKPPSSGHSPFSPPNTPQDRNERSKGAPSSGPKPLTLTYSYDAEGSDGDRTRRASLNVPRDVEKAKDRLRGNELNRSHPRPQSARTARPTGGRYTSVADGWVAGAKGGGFRVQQDASAHCQRCAILAAELQILQKSRNSSSAEVPASRAQAQSPGHKTPGQGPPMKLTRSDSGSTEPKAQIDISALLKLQAEKDHFQHLYQELKHKDMEVVDYYQMKEENGRMEEEVAVIKEKMHEMELRMHREHTEGQHKIRKHLHAAQESQKRELESHQRQAEEMQSILTDLRLVEIENEILKREKGMADSRVITIQGILAEKDLEVEAKEAERLGVIERNKELSETIDEKEAEIQRLEEQKMSLNERIQDQLQEKGYLMNKLQDAQRFLQGYSDKQKKVEARIRNLEGELQEAHTGLVKAAKQRASLLEDLDDQRLEADMQYVEAQKKQMKLMDSLHQASQISEGLREDLHHYKEENEMLQRHRDESEDAMRELMSNVSLASFRTGNLEH